MRRKQAPMTVPSAISIRGARTHNLRNIDLDIPLGCFVGIAGVSGSGKSSLAMDVLYAEGSRRYLEALSTYTRRRMTFAAEADLDSIDHVPAALALRQRPAEPDIRTTFGTATELLNITRLMVSRLGAHRCPRGHLVPPSPRVAMEKPLHCPTCGEEFYGPGAEELAFNSDGACPQCSGTGTIREVDTATLVPDPSLTLAEGAVSAWNQFGIAWMYRVAGELGVRVDVPYRDLSEKEQHLVLYGEEVTQLTPIPSKNGKLFELNATYLNAHRAIEEGLAKATSEKSLTKINRFLRVRTCPLCDGTRLSERARSSQLCGHTLPKICTLPLSTLREWIEAIPAQMEHPSLRAMAESMVRQFNALARRLLDLGLGYLSMDRPGSTLSTGERQRMQLARAVRNRTTGVLYVLDEPSIGLHPSNMEGLLAVIRDLVDAGNSVVMVDHDVRMLRQVDHLIELGPGAGTEGGHILAQGTVEEVIANPHTRIGEFLSGERSCVARADLAQEEVFAQGCIHMETAALHTVHPLNVDIPRGKLTVVTGPSGSGKTTMVLECLVPALQSSSEKLPAPVRVLTADGITRATVIDSTQIGANVRSTVATYTGILDDARRLFAASPEAKASGRTAGAFSYNTGALRCEECDGTGHITMDVQFLPDVTVTCPSCQGTRYSDEAERYRIGNEQPFTPRQLMTMTVTQLRNSLGRPHNAPMRRIARALDTLESLGVGYLALGEGTPLLSGGEAQRLKLASEMTKPQEQALYVFDEPTIGLHPLDVERLLGVLRGLTDAGATVVVIEHDLDMIASADYAIDLGPGGGADGGRIVYSGPPATMRSCPQSTTGRYL